MRWIDDEPAVRKPGGGQPFQELIELKRDGGSHTPAQMERIVRGYVTGDVLDYQMAAWLMAVYFMGLDAEETVLMTDAMVRSGRELDLSAIPGVKVDKHSTGGVADTTTLALAPLVAACGVPVAKMSGRGLGHTGGTLDKLESIPGFRVELSPADFVEQVKRVGVAVIAQSPDIDPADKKIYALRDVTGTVPSIPLIVGSVISKKIAGGADAILLDVKVGSGAFMKTEDDARELARELIRVGRALGRDVHAVLTDMDQPLGNAIGNALEVREAMRVLRGEGPERLTEVVLTLGAKMLVLGKVSADEQAGREKLERVIGSGEAIERFRSWVRAQGGDPRVVDDPDVLARAVVAKVVKADRSGYLASFDAEQIGRAAMLLGAGRAEKDAAIDPAAGIQLLRRIGDRVEVGEPVAVLHARRDRLIEEGERRFLDAVAVSEEPVTLPPLLREV